MICEEYRRRLAEFLTEEAIEEMQEDRVHARYLIEQCYAVGMSEKDLDGILNVHLEAIKESLYR